VLIFVKKIMMHNKSLLVFLLLTAFSGNMLKAQEKSQSAPDKNSIHWYSFEEAYNLSKKKPRKIFVDVYTEWCGWCKKMDAETFANPVIAAYMSKHYYCVKLDAERKDTVVIDGVKMYNPNPANKRSTHQLANELLRNKMSYPSYVFLNEKGQMLTTISGYQPPREFDPVIHYFGEEAYLKNNWEVFKSGYKGEFDK
jgi:thioredoxin-related protein